MKGIVSHGLMPVVELLAISDHDMLEAKMQRYLAYDQCIDDSITVALSTTARSDRLREHGKRSPQRGCAHERGRQLRRRCGAA